MDKQAAAKILPMLLQAAQQIADTVEVLKAHAPDERVERYSDAVGDVILAIDGLVRPIVQEHPDLHP